MRSFKKKVVSAVAWALPVLAAALPANAGAEVARPDGNGNLLQLDVQQDYAQATFSVPCTGCLGQSHTDQDDESLILNFRTHFHDQACGASNLSLNGVDLPQVWNGDFASGSGSYVGITDLQNEWVPQRDLDLEWNSTCLHGTKEGDQAAQVLTVNIKAVDGRPLDTPSGFTISFEQHNSPPSLLRLATVPDPSATALEVSETWRDPPTHLRIVVNVPERVQANTSAVSIADDIRELKALQAELKKIQQAIAQKKQYINSRFRKEANIFTDELTQCEGISCVTKTIADKAHSAWRVLYVHLHPNSQKDAMGRPEQTVFASAHVSSQKSGGRIQVEALEVNVSEFEPRPYEASTNELPARPQRQSPHIIALEIALGILCCGCLVAVIRHKCASLRTRTERAADYEERYNARIFKRAARRHAWRNWWRGNWRAKDEARITDYEEKRALIAAQEDVLESAMQAEIRQLRAAHGLVNDIIRAEEGRRDPFSCPCPHRHFHAIDPDTDSSLPPPSPTSTYPPTSAPSLPSRPPSRTDSLPSYRSSAPTEPPGYDSDASEAGVANGFGFRPCAARGRATSLRSAVSELSRWTPDSSVVDVSPRPSAETLRRSEGVFVLGECDSDEEEEL